MDKKGEDKAGLLILGIVAVVAVVGLVLLFSGAKSSGAKSGTVMQTGAIPAQSADVRQDEFKVCTKNTGEQRISDCHAADPADGQWTCDTSRCSGGGGGGGCNSDGQCNSICDCGGSCEQLVGGGGTCRCFPCPPGGGGGGGGTCSQGCQRDCNGLFDVCQLKSTVPCGLKGCVPPDQCTPADCRESGLKCCGR